MRLAPIGVGAFLVGRGREREEEFSLGERAFGEELGGGILASALRDALSAATFQNLLQGRGGLFGFGGGTDAQRVSDPFRNLQIFAQSGIPGIPTRR